MSVINFRRKEIIAKVVYYGPGLSGKTTNVKQIHASMPADSRGELTSLATEQDRTLFFDYVPIHLGNIGGFKTKFQIFTVPGQVYYSATRRVVLQSTDGIVFVADSSPEALERNKESLNDLRQNLLHYDKFLNTIPFVIQYNKRDLPDALPIEVLERELNQLGVPSFSAVASNSEGVLETLSRISSLVLTHLKQSIEGRLSKGKKDPGIVQKFDDEEQDDATLVRQLLAQISEVRKHEAAEISIVDEEDEEEDAVAQSTVTRREAPKPGQLPPMPSIAAVAEPSDSGHAAIAPSSSPSPAWSVAPSAAPEPVAAPVAPLAAGLETARPPTHGGQGAPLAAGPVRTPEPPTPRASGPNRSPYNAPPTADVQARAPQPPPPPPPRPAADRAMPGFQPGDAPPWDNRSPARPSGTIQVGKSIPVSGAGGLEVVDVGQVQRRGAELYVPITVRDTSTGSVRPLAIQFKLTGLEQGISAPIPAWIFAWLGGVTVLTLLAIFLAL